MAKMKTHSGTKKRFRLTASNHLKHKQPGKNHKTGGKPTKRIRGLRAKAYLEGKQGATIKNMLHQ